MIDCKFVLRDCSDFRRSVPLAIELVIAAQRRGVARRELKRECVERFNRHELADTTISVCRFRRSSADLMNAQCGKKLLESAVAGIQLSELVELVYRRYLR